MSNMVHLEHPFEPIYDAESSILILGTMPSVKSREAGFYYANPRNAFWRIIASICGCTVPATDDDKKQMLLKNHIALWDVCKKCDIKGSDDSSIKNEVPTDIPGLLRKTSIRTIYANGTKAFDQYNKLVKPQTHMDIILLPSTSPAYCKINEQEKLKIWTETIK
jgi:hypoxanthine-DNA glycosylase